MLGHRGLLLGRHRLGEIRTRRNQPEQEERCGGTPLASWGPTPSRGTLARRAVGGRLAHSAARVAGCTAISPKPLRRLHIAASSEYAFSPRSSVNSAASDSHTCLAPTCALGSPVQYQCRSAPPSPPPPRPDSGIVVSRSSAPSARAT